MVFLADAEEDEVAIIVALVEGDHFRSSIVPAAEVADAAADRPAVMMDV